jgi:hypothetical protein
MRKISGANSAQTVEWILHVYRRGDVCRASSNRPPFLPNLFFGQLLPVAIILPPFKMASKMGSAAEWAAPRRGCAWGRAGVLVRDSIDSHRSDVIETKNPFFWTESVFWNLYYKLTRLKAHIDYIVVLNLHMYICFLLFFFVWFRDNCATVPSPGHRRIAFVVSKRGRDDIFSKNWNFWYENMYTHRQPW